MTQDEDFKTWWYNEGSQAPYTHHDCEEHTMRMCEIAWKNAVYKEREESARVRDYNRGWNDCLFASGTVKQSQRTWVGLTDEEVNNAIKEKNIAPLFTYRMIARTIESKLKEKNGFFEENT
jgi:hypothetical protein